MLEFHVDQVFPSVFVRVLGSHYTKSRGKTETACNYFYDFWVTPGKDELRKLGSEKSQNLAKTLKSEVVEKSNFFKFFSFPSTLELL